MADEEEGWDEEVEVLVRVRVKVKPNPEFFEGWQGRTALGLAQTAVWTGLSNPEIIDGYADLTGDVDIVEVSEA